jgi:simple sugar transport system permease protein
MGKVTDVLVPPAPIASVPERAVVTLENVRAVSRSRSFGFGVAVIVIALIELLKFGLWTSGLLESTITFDDNTATAIPSLSTAIPSPPILLQVVVGVLGGVAIAAGVMLITRRKTQAFSLLLVVVGLILVAWPFALLANLNGPGLQQVAVGVLGGLTTAAGVMLVVRRRAQSLSVVLIAAGVLLVAWPLALLANLNGPGDILKPLTLPVTGAAWVVGAVTLVGGLVLVVTRSARAAYPIFFVTMALFILVFLLWVSRGSSVSIVPQLTLTPILASTFIAATPLMFGSLAGLVCERAGVVNIAIEGQFMLGALGSSMLTSYIGATTLGFAAGTAVAAALGGLLGAILAYMALHFRANQIIVGVVIVSFCTALVQFMQNQVLNNSQWLNMGYGTQPIAIPWLSRIPVLGPVVFDENYFVYLAIVLVALVNVILFRTRWGLRIRSVGEKPKASETVGLNVTRIRFLVVVLGGMIAGIGGAAFTIGLGTPMIVGITGGQGFIALAIMIFGRWRPWGAFSATLLFGFSLAIGTQYGLYGAQFGVPDQLITALPYLITIAAVAGLVGRPRPPAADGIPYERE